MRYRFPKKGEVAFNDGWSFALLNNRLAEIYFKKNYGIWGHCYITRDKCSKAERRMVVADTKRCVFGYRRGVYFDQLACVKFRRVLPWNIFGRFHVKRKKVL